ncbi:MAG: type II toxin-antitoxin system Phd/YefM family antitoxin [Deltaproteobacteria bacterium]|nr:type II toxin-antitoxin system Phd/YefM family antitoxin [Deltaproteobacteria bacterium]
MKLRQGLGALLNEIVYRGDEIIIERAGKPVAALISMDDYEVLLHSREAAAGNLKKIWDKIGDKPDTNQTDSLIAEAIQAVRTK